MRSCKLFYLIDREMEQLRMLLLGPGGTGKSKLIGTTMETFSHYEEEEILVKCATTGIAATDIGDRTLHSWACLPHTIPKVDDWIENTMKATNGKQQLNIREKRFIIIDKISMANKGLLYCASEIVGSVIGKEGKGSVDDPFGGVNVILAGDFHQFPPISNASGASYMDRTEDSKQALIGWAIFNQFDMVVILDKQKWATGKIWINILEHIGQCNHNDGLDEPQLHQA